MNNLSLSKKQVTIALLGIISVLLVSLFYLQHVYALVAVAFALAYLVDPVVALLERYKVPRTLGSLLVLVLVFVVLGFALVLLTPKVAAQGRELLLKIPEFYHHLARVLGPRSERYLGYNIFQDLDQALSVFFGSGESLGSVTEGAATRSFLKPFSGVVGSIFSTTIRFATAVLGMLIIPLMALYFLHIFPQMYQKILYLIPPRFHKTAGAIRKRLNVVLGGYLRGQLIVCTVLAVYYSTAFSILGIKLGLVLGLLAGTLNIIPYVGITFVLLLTLLSAFVHNVSASTYIVIGIVFSIGMALEGTFLTPRIVGKKVGLNPLVLIIALLIGGELRGFVGMIIAIPLTAIGKVFLDVAVEAYRKSSFFKNS